MEESQKRNIWNGNCIGQRIREKQNIKPYEVKRNCFAESYLLEYYWSKEQIYDCVWKEPYFGDYNIVMSHIRNLREKIEDNPSKPMYIQTVWGVGYRFNKNLSSGL
ncbi:helix-turn-helix domain-containing protein [Blautia sp. NSJ-157]|uniref:winged helix-turn-helix domain-containing protein n=1 Tax=Blautia sp. NSJ-157 TaxID=2931393 RepID=UPI001FD14A76|nr:helix-turn-helix domain-containing protein [Blautia sp. NSJ-157]MCJ7860558.1 helix-turn-helix domain-containing protein [Blautia sp. NSJ-157]